MLLRIHCAISQRACFRAPDFRRANRLSVHQSEFHAGVGAPDSVSLPAAMAD